MTDFKPGQKWISSAEPDLGMGQVMRVEHRFVHCYFDQASEERTYASAQAPLIRVKFNPGDQVATRDGVLLTVNQVAERDGIYVYHGEYNGTNTAVMETELDPNVRFSKPEERLFTYQLDDNRWFDLRYQTLQHRADWAASSTRGLCGPRVSLVPHQLYIAAEVAGRYAPRVLLADEVGLGKTIEAGLIIHQQLQTGRAGRVLVIVPPALTFQWFVEMIRRFNLQFVVMDEERAQQIVADNTPEFEEDDDNVLDNPFEAQQLVLCSLDLLTQHPARLEQAVQGNWDLVVVDEAHHLQWSPGNASEEYNAVEALAASARGLLLLTATPEQLGKAGHFARLRLLDPHRFHDFDSFVAEEAEFQSIADAASTLLNPESGDQAARQLILDRLEVPETTTNTQLVDMLLDQHGTGRVLFRNVRASVEGFPARQLEVTMLTPPDGYPTEYSPERGVPNWTDVDPRVEWLIELLTEGTLAPEDKVLVICRFQQTAIELERHLSLSTTIRSTVFHEGMDLVARDRAANYFSDTERGATVMICSEIGSEGRNFQFASHMVLFDLPPGPDLVEQRIGRLDRIGQRNDVVIHVPVLEGLPGANLFRWYEEGLDLFRAPNPAAQGIFDELSGQFEASDDIEAFLAQSSQINEERRAALRQGRDRLIELNSHRPDVSEGLVADIETEQGDQALRDYMEASFDVFGLESEPLGDQVEAVKPTEQAVRNAATSVETQGHYHYPEIPEDGIRITYNRATALAREDVIFLTWEAPIVADAMDVVLTDVVGSSAMIAIKDSRFKSGTLLLECLHTLDCVAPAELMADRYLPPGVVRTMMTPALENIADRLDYDPFLDSLAVPRPALQQILESQIAGVRGMLEAAQTEAETSLTGIRDAALARMQSDLDEETSRLRNLAKVNPLVRTEEIEFLESQRERLTKALEATEMRLEAVRVIVVA